LAGGVSPANDANKQYVELPTGCLTGLTDATFEAWVTWSTTCAPTPCTNNVVWQRVFDFGEASTSTTGSNVFLTTRANTNGPVRTALATAGASSETTSGFQLDGVMITAGSFHFAVVVNDTADTVEIYMDGAQSSSDAFMGALSSVVPTNCWLGRANYSADAYYNGSFDEFRIYDQALSASAINQSFSSGPDAGFL
jgi:hypothetical protein